MLSVILSFRRFSVSKFSVRAAGLPTKPYITDKQQGSLLGLSINETMLVLLAALGKYMYHKYVTTARP